MTIFGLSIVFIETPLLWSVVMDSEPLLHHAWNLSQLSIMVHFRCILSSTSSGVQINSCDTNRPATTTSSGCNSLEKVFYIDSQPSITTATIAILSGHLPPSGTQTVIISVFKNLTIAAKSLQKDTVYFSLDSLLWLLDSCYWRGKSWRIRALHVWLQWGIFAAYTHLKRHLDTVSVL